MSDIALVASVDFSKAEGDVNTFVTNTKKKLSTILADAQRVGGSLSGIVRNGSGAQPVGMTGTRGAPASSLTSALRSNALDNFRQQTDKMQALERAFAEGTIKFRRGWEGEYTRWWSAELSHRARLEREASKLREDEARRYTALEKTEAQRVAEVQKAKAAESAAFQKSVLEQAKRERQSYSAMVSRLIEQEAAKAREISEWEKAEAARVAAVRKEKAEEAARFEAAKMEQKKREAASYTAFWIAELDKQAAAEKARNDQSKKLSQAVAAQQSSQRTTITRTGAANLTFQNLSDKVVKTFGAGTVEEVAITGKLNSALNDYISTINRYGTASLEAARKAVEWKQAINDTKNAITAASAAAGANANKPGVPFLTAQTLVGQRADFSAISNAEVAALGVNKRIGRQLGDDPKLQEQLTRQLQAALDDYTRAITTYGVKSMEAARATDAWKKELTNVRSSIAENGGLLKTLNRNAADLRDRLSNLGGSFGGLSRMVMNTRVAVSSLMAAFGLREVVQSIQEFERFSATLRTVSGSSAGFQENLRYLYAEANRVGFAVGEVGNSFARLSLAMKNAGFTQDQTRQVFTGLSEAARNFGLSSSDTMGVIRALEQSMSKGVFQAEEVRLQLGDRLPVAMAALRAAMEKVDGQTVDVNKRFEEGTIDVQRYAVEFVNQINRMSGGAETLNLTANSISAAFGRLSTEFTRTAETLGSGGFSAAVVSVTNQIGNLIKQARESGGLEAIGSIALSVANNFTTLASAIAAGVAVLALIRVPAMFVALAAAMTPIGAAITAVTLAAAGLGAAYAHSATEVERASRTIQQAHTSSSSIVEQSANKVAEANRLLETGISQAASETDSQTDRIARSYARMGYSISESMRLAMEDTKKAMEAQVVVLRTQLEEASTALRNATDRQFNLRRVDQRVDGAIAAATSSAYGNGTPPPALTDFARDFRALVSIIRDGSEPLEVVGRVMADLNAKIVTFRDALPDDDAYRGAFTQLSTVVNDVVLALGNMGNVDLSNLRNGVAGITANLQTQLANIRTLSATLANFGLNTNNDGPNTAPIPLGYRPVNLGAARTSSQSSAETWLRAQLRSAGAIGAPDPVTRSAARLGAAPELGSVVARGQVPATANANTMLGYISSEANRGNADATRILTEYNRKVREAQTETGRLSNAVKELMDDMERQARMAGTDAGAASTLAQALNRLEDAAKSANGQIDIEAERPRVIIAVFRQLEQERNKFIRETGRATAATNATANAWMDSANAGQQAEIRTRAYAEALKYAKHEVDGNGNATGAYLEEINQLIPVLTDAERAERNLATARQIASNRDDLEVIELETRLIGMNTNAVQAEVAALRARQAARGSDPSTIDAAERSARQLTEARLNSEQLQNSWQDLARMGEQAFDRIGSAITEAFAQGKISSISFAKIAKAMISEVIQSALRLAVINPMLNSMFGGTRGTLDGLFTVMNSPNFGGFGGGIGMLTGSVATAGASSGGGFFSNLGSLGGLSNLGGLSGNGLGMFSALGNGINDFASYATGGFFAPSALSATNTALAGMEGGMMGPATESAFMAAGGGGASFTSLLGGMGTGFMLGSAVGSMIAGDSQARQTNSMIGAGLGAILGGPIGGLAGGALGGLIGPGKGFSGGDALIGFDDNGMLQVTGYAGKNFDGQGQLMEQARQQTKQFNAQLKALGLSFSGRTPEGGFAAAIGGGESPNPTDIAGALGAFGYGGKSLVTDNKNLRTALDNMGDKSFENILEDAAWVVGTYDVLTNATGAYVKSVEDLNKKFDEALEKTRELGLSEADLTKARDRALADMAEQRNAQLDSALLSVESRALRLDGGINNAAYADLYEQTARAQTEKFSYRQSLESFGLSDDEIAKNMARLEEVQGKERAAIYEKYENIVRDWVVGTYNVLTKQTNSFSASIAALNDQFDAAAKTARELGYSEDMLNEARNEALSEAYAVRNSQVSSLRGGLTIRNLRTVGDDASNQAADLMEFDLAAVQERIGFKKTMFDLGMTTAEINAEMVRLEETLGLERLSIIKKYSDAIAATEKQNRETAQGNAISMLNGISDYIKGLRTGDASPLDARAQYDLANSDFNSIAAKAAAGDANAMVKLTGYADTLIAASRNINGSGTAYVQDFDRVIAALEQVADQGPDTLTASFLARTTETQTTTLVQSLTAVKEEITALRREVRQQATTPERVS